MKQTIGTTGLLGGLLLLGVVLSPAVQATAATCTSTGMVGSKEVSAYLGPAIDCTEMAKGNLAHKSDELPLDVFGEKWDLIQQDVVPSDGSSGALVITDTSGDSTDSKSGTWSIDLSQVEAYKTFVVGLKPDGGFAYWNVGDATNGTYFDLSHALSHANLYGRVVVPVPAAIWLFGSGLVGLLGFSAKRRRSALQISG